MSNSGRLTSLLWIEAEEKRKQEEKSSKEKLEQMEKKIDDIVSNLNSEYDKLMSYKCPLQ